MSQGLPVSNIIDVTIDLAPQAAQGVNLNSLLVLGSSNIIDVSQRIRSYANISQVIADFGLTAPEYFAARAYFSQSPQPDQLYIGRWAQNAVAGLNRGGLLVAAEQAIANWNIITNGAINLTIDGTARNLTALDFSTSANLNAVAAVIAAALAPYGSVTWNGSQFQVTSATLGSGNYAQGTITLTANPANNDTVTINGTTITFVTGTPAAFQVKIGAGVAQTAANLQAFLQASVDVNLAKSTYATNPSTGVTVATSKLIGTVGNGYTLVKVSANITLSGANFAGGTAASTVGYATTGAGTDISAQMKLTAALASNLVAGVNAETPDAGIAVFINNFSSQFLGVMIASATALTDLQHLACCDLIEADQAHLYGITSQNTAIIDSTSTTDLASLMKAAGYKYSFIQYSSSSIYAVASMFGRLLTVNFNGNNTTITIMFKQEPTITGELLTQTQAQAVGDKNCNVFVGYNNDTFIIQYGETPSGLFLDTIYNSIWLRNELQTAMYNALYTSTTKIPQTDDGMNVLQTVIESVCSQAVINGFLAPGTWTATGFGTLQYGDFLPKGFYVYAPAVSSQSVADRGARKSVPFQIAAKEAGAVQSVNIAVTVNH